MNALTHCQICGARNCHREACAEELGIRESYAHPAPPREPDRQCPDCLGCTPLSHPATCRFCATETPDQQRARMHAKCEAYAARWRAQEQERIRAYAHAGSAEAA